MSSPDLSGLHQYIEDWGLETRDKRLAKRMASSIDELSEFYHALTPYLEEIIEFLDSCDLEDIPSEHRKLAWAVLSVAEIDASVWYWKAVMLPHMDDAREWTSKTSFYDTDSPLDMPR